MKKLLITLAAVFVSTLVMAQTPNKNYVKSTSYQQPVQNEADVEALPLLDKYESVTYYDGLGRPEQSIALRQGGVLNPQNELTYDWEDGNIGSTNFFYRNGLDNENRIITGITPSGDTDLLWECHNQDGDNSSDVRSDGGWNTSYFTVDKTVGYRYTTWVKRSHSVSDGRAYHGTQNVSDLNGNALSNPYFWHGFLPELDTWYLMVGVIHPYDYTGGDTGESGVYDIEGNKIIDGQEFKWRADTSVSRFRNYLYYTTDLNVKQYFYKPLLQRLDGEPLTIAQVVNDTYVKDIITPVVYDAHGRKTKDYLPYADLSQGEYVPNDLVAIPSINNYYTTTYSEDLDATPNPYSEKHLEPSPLSRLLEQGAPGADWKVDKTANTDHTIKFDYQSNTVNEVINYTVIFPTDNTEVPQLHYNGTYSAGQLYKSITKDENWSPNQTHLKNHTTEEFKNKQGQVVLKRTYSDNGSENIAHDTQYVYDDYGNLTYVLSPKGSDAVLTENQYKDFNQNLSPYDFIFPARYLPNTATGTASINLQGTTLTLNLNVQFSSPRELHLGPIAQLTDHVPNIDFNTGVSLNGYELKIEDGYLKLSHPQSLYSSSLPSMSGITGAFTVTVPEYSINMDIMDALGYQYHYDNRNRLVEKKIPGKDWEYIIYDKLDRPVLTQDANQRLNNEWLFTKYDIHSRPIYTGKHTFNPTGITDNAGRIELQETINLQSIFNEHKLNTALTIGDTSLYYNNTILPINNIEVYTVNYYDTYPQDIATVVPDINTFTLAGQTYTTTSNATSLPTGNKVRILGTNQWIIGATYYDDKARPIYIASNNAYLNTTDLVKTALDFVGKALETESTHIKDGVSIITNDAFTYDHASRLVTQTQTINNGTPELIVNNSYDDLGQLISKKVGGSVANEAENSTGLQTVDYKYNIRGWLKDINDFNNLGDDLFGFHLSYNTIKSNNGSELYNGNISETFWSTNNEDNTERGYVYTYDALNRLTDAKGVLYVFGQYHGHHSLYNEGGMQYDKNGNLLYLFRKKDQTLTIDNLAYTYDLGNKLLSVTDNSNNDLEGFLSDNKVGNDYAYDANGNMVKDLNKEIGTTTTEGITYNHLNLPTSITFNNDVTKTISYIYDATGVKQAKVVTNGSSLTTTKYAGNFIYKGSNGNTETLEFFNHPEGYVEPHGNGFRYVYQYKDHLGNIRISYSDYNGDGNIDIMRNGNDMDGDMDNQNDIVEESNYYPFGLKHQGYNDGSSSGEEHSFKYNGKEFESELNLNTYDYHARLYDPAIGRMMQVDPHAENWSPVSPYVYTINNPVNFVDPDGKDARISFNVDDDGNITISIQSTVHLYGGSSSKGFAKELNSIVSKFGSKSYAQDDGTSVKVDFDISYEHHDSEESAKEALDASPGDNIMQVDKDLSNAGMGAFPYSGTAKPRGDTEYGVTIGGGKEANSRGKNGSKLHFTAIHETFHFFGLEDKYTEGILSSQSKEGYENDVLGLGNRIYWNGGTDSNPNNLSVHQSHYNTMGQFLISNNPTESKNGGTRIYQTVSPNIQSGLQNAEK